jgi:hypothetical protein
MTAKELILKMIENELKVQTIIDHMYVKENDPTIEQLQKLKQIVENPAEVYISEVNPKVEVTFLNQEL